MLRPRPGRHVPPDRGNPPRHPPLYEFGYSDEDIRKMVSNNAAKMLGIEEDLPERAVA